MNVVLIYIANAARAKRLRFLARSGLPGKKDVPFYVKEKRDEDDVLLGTIVFRHSYYVTIILTVSFPFPFLFAFCQRRQYANFVLSNKTSSLSGTS